LIAVSAFICRLFELYNIQNICQPTSYNITYFLNLKKSIILLFAKLIWLSIEKVLLLLLLKLFRETLNCDSHIDSNI